LLENPPLFFSCSKTSRCSGSSPPPHSRYAVAFQMPSRFFFFSRHRLKNPGLHNPDEWDILFTPSPPSFPFPPPEVSFIASTLSLTMFYAKGHDKGHALLPFFPLSKKVYCLFSLLIFFFFFLPIGNPLDSFFPPSNALPFLR